MWQWGYLFMTWLYCICLSHGLAVFGVRYFAPVTQGDCRPATLRRPTVPRDWPLLLFIALSGAWLWSRMYRLSPEPSLFSVLKIQLLLTVLWASVKVDVERQIIPNQFILIGLAAALVFLLPELPGRSMSELLTGAKTLGIILLILVLLYPLSGGGIGPGDSKLLLVVYLFLGLKGFLLTVLGAVVCVFLTAVFLLSTGKSGRKDRLAFAPFVLAGAVFSIFLGSGG